MVKRLNANPHSIPNCYGGNGDTRVENLFKADELYAHPICVDMVSLGKDDTVGYHQHVGDMEVYVIVNGNAVFNDNGTEVILYPGDSVATLDGESHAIKPYQCDELNFVALIYAK